MYNKDTEYNVKYVTKDGKEETKQITPSEDMSKPQMIMKLKEEDNNFFKLIEGFEYITPEELKKLHKDYKSTVGDIIKFSKYRGQDPEEVRKRYKDLGYDETDPMIVTSDGKGGTILKPVKVKKEESKMSKTLFDYLDEHSFEGVDIQDTVYDMSCWFEFTIEDADSDPFDMFMSKLAKSLHIDFEDVNKTVVVDLTNWVTKNYEKLEEIFDLSGEDKESNIEELVGSIMPGVLSGYTTDSVYKELAANMIMESKKVDEENEDEFEELENLDEEKPLTETTNKEIQKMKQDLYARERQSLKELGDENWENLVGLKDRMPDDMLDKFLKEKEVINTIEMIHSILTYTSKTNWTTDYVMSNKYMQSHIKELGEEKVKELAEQEIKEYEQATINKDVYTDNEDVSYNSVTFKDDVEESKKITEDEEIEDSEEVEQEETLEESIKRAHEEEIDAINTYDTILSKTDESTDAKLIEMINEIKKDEEDHKTLLQHYIETGEVWTDEDLNKTDSEDVEVEQEDTEELEESKELRESDESILRLVKKSIVDGKLPNEIKYKGKTYKQFNVMSSDNSGETSDIYFCNMEDTPSGDPQQSNDYFFVKVALNKTENGYKGIKEVRFAEDLTESKECVEEDLPKQAPLDSLLDMVTEATSITELEEIIDSILDSELKEDLKECIDDEDAKAYGEDIYFNTAKLNMQNIIEDYMDEQ